MDDSAIAMTFSESKTMVGNIGSTTHEISARRPVSWVPRKDCPPETRVDVIGPHEAHFVFTLSTGEAYNTWIWEGMSARLVFCCDFSGVDILWDHIVDTAT
ncbi:hypothetical protein AB0C27_55945 [Nonomuraea sp. NPDC048882]|uniref:hypothetical protein n=1 Tax=Nonomuraea sp. NPDC048882 TaxID=3154347 RepID=UPI00340F1903